ncbi:MAG: serine protease [Chthoniobacterales bacterium]
MRLTFLQWIFLPMLAFIIATGTPAVLAQAPDAAAGETVFGGGLSLVLPPGWKTSVLNTSEPPKDRHQSFDDPDTLVLLAQARSGDAKRSASLTLLRDDSFGGHAGPMARKEMLARLNELVLASGFTSGRMSEKGHADGPRNVLLGTIDGVAADGQKRIFNCVTINRFPQSSFRCYWQYDPTDPVAQGEFDSWLATVSIDHSKVADVLSGASTMDVAASSSTPAVASADGTPPAAAGLPIPEIPSAATGEMINKNRASLIVVQGDKGMGSGFVCNFNGEPWLLTNAHVLSNNPHPRFSTIGGAVTANGPAFLAVDHDICKIKMPAGTAALEVMSEADSNIKIGDAIVVLGNAEGQGVIHPFQGHIVGMGPNLVEVDAPFVPGNSGSPIIHSATGKVIGIATYLVTKKVADTDEKTATGEKADKAVKETIRRFGYRIDNVQTWEPINWPRFYAQSAQASSIQTTGEEFQQLFADARAKKLFASSYHNVGIQRALDTYASRIRTGSHMSDADRSFAVRELLANLRTASQTDVRAFDSRNAYDYFRRTVADESRFRDEIYSGFTRSLNSTTP